MYVMISATFILQIFSVSCNYYHPHEQSSPSRRHFYKGSSKLSSTGDHLLNYNIIRNRFHPSTFSITEEEHQGDGSESQVQYTTFTDSDNHEGEVMMHHHQQQHVVGEGNVGDAYIHDSRYPQYSPGEEMSGYHTPSASYPTATAPYHHPYAPPLPPPPPPPHKSKNTAAYTYYYLGRHLWYIPLYFSIYFIVYVGLLVLKSIARHKIQFPQNLHEAAISRDQHVLRSIQKVKERYFM